MLFRLYSRAVPNHGDASFLLHVTHYSRMSLSRACTSRSTRSGQKSFLFLSSCHRVAGFCLIYLLILLGCLWLLPFYPIRPHQQRIFSSRPPEVSPKARQSALGNLGGLVFRMSILLGCLWFYFAFYPLRPHQRRIFFTFPKICGG